MSRAYVTNDEPNQIIFSFITTSDIWMYLWFVHSFWATIRSLYPTGLKITISKIYSN